jgi:cell division protein FtsB
MNGFGTLDRLVIMLLPIILILAIAGVIVLRPLSKALGELLLRLRTETDQQVAIEARLESLAESVSRIESQVKLLQRGNESGAFVESESVEATST